MTEARQPGESAVVQAEGPTHVRALRRNVEATRDHLAESLTTLKWKLTPSEMIASTRSTVETKVRRTMDDAAREVQEGGRRVARVVQAEPGFAAMVAAGAVSAVWFLTQRRSVRRQRLPRRPLDDSVTAVTRPSTRRATGWQAGVASAVTTALATAVIAATRRRDAFDSRDPLTPGWGGRAAAGAGRATASAERAAGTLRRGATALAQNVVSTTSSLDAGVTASIGVVAGVLAAMLLPASEWEREMFARAQRTMRDAAVRAFREGGQHAQRALLPAALAIVSQNVGDRARVKAGSREYAASGQS
jgi:hypothetical protein